MEVGSDLSTVRHLVLAGVLIENLVVTGALNGKVGSDIT